MKRSEINRLIDQAIELIGEMGTALPPQAHWGLEAWLRNRDRAGDLAKRGVGWDITDFGRGRFKKYGLILYTLSNGIIDPRTGEWDQPYANKLLLIGAGQVTVMHHHYAKTEDIIVLAGGDLKLQLYNAGPADGLDRSGEVRVLINNLWEARPAGAVVSLLPGERIRLEPGHFHKFWADGGPVLAEEVSMVNDDVSDNCFLPEDNVGRFPEIEEDEPPRHLLCTELPGTGRFERLAEARLGRRDVLVLNTTVVDIRSPGFEFVEKLVGDGGVARADPSLSPAISQETIGRLIAEGRAVAGGPGNCAPLMARAGLRVTVGANLGRGRCVTRAVDLNVDVQGKFFSDVMADNNVEAVAITTHRSLSTGTAFIKEPHGAKRGGIAYFAGVNDRFSFSRARQAVKDLNPRVVYYMYSGLSDMGDANSGRDLARFVSWCRSRGVVTIVDSHTLVSDPKRVIREGKPVKAYRLLLPLLPVVDVFFTSREEARMIANTLPCFGRDKPGPGGHAFNLKFLDRLMEHYRPRDGKTKLLGLTVSDGAYFTVAAPGGGVVRARKVKSNFLAGENVDLVGAGDAFRAGLLTYLVNHLDEFRSGRMNFEHAVQTGNLFASLYIKAPLNDRYSGIMPFEKMRKVVESGKEYKTMVGLKKALSRP